MIKINEFEIRERGNSYEVYWCDPHTSLLPFLSSYDSLKKALNDVLFKIHLSGLFENGLMCFEKPKKKKFVELSIPFVD